MNDITVDATDQYMWSECVLYSLDGEHYTDQILLPHTHVTGFSYNSTPTITLRAG